VASPLALESRDLVLEIHGFLRDLDPAVWSEDLRVTLAARIDAIRVQAHRVLDDLRAAAAAWTHGMPLLEPVDTLVASLDRAPTATDSRAVWMAFRKVIATEYAQLAQALASFDVHVPALRPTNYLRNVFHVLNAVWVLAIVEYVLVTPTLLIGVAVFGAVWAWSMEISRRVSPAANRLLMKVFSKVAHPHETHRVNSATWYATAFVLLATLFPLHLGVAALAVLGLGDPAAAIIGRRFGRHRFANGRSVEGSLAFVVFGGLAGAGALALWYPELGAVNILATTLVVAFCGGLAELWTRRIDDNFAIPIAGAVGGQLMLWAGLLS
jgi:dolichol kinase